jgi:hypothetical protein
MTVRLDEIKPGDVLSYWHETFSGGGTGLSEANIAFVRVLKVGRKKILAVGEGENAAQRWMYPEFFNRKMSERDVAELRADGVRI